MTSTTPVHTPLVNLASAAEARGVAERYATAWLENDLDGILGCYSDGFTVHYFGDHPFSGEHVGKVAVVELLLETGRRAARELLAVDEILAGPSAALMVVRESIEVAGERTEIRRILRYRIADDQFVECWLYEEQQALIDQAWADPD